MTDTKKVLTDGERLGHIEAVLSKIAAKLGIEIEPKDDFEAEYERGRKMAREFRKQASNTPREWEGR